MKLFFLLSVAQNYLSAFGQLRLATQQDVVKSQAVTKLLLASTLQQQDVLQTKTALPDFAQTGELSSLTVALTDVGLPRCTMHLLFHNFPDKTFETTTKQGLLHAVDLIEEMLASGSEAYSHGKSTLENSKRYLAAQWNKKILKEANHADGANNITIHFWFDDPLGPTSFCAQGTAAYRSSSNSDTANSDIILCPQIFQFYPRSLDATASVRHGRPASSVPEAIGLAISREMIYLFGFTSNILFGNSLGVPSLSRRGNEGVQSTRLRYSSSQDEVGEYYPFDAPDQFAVQAMIISQYYSLDLDGEPLLVHNRKSFLLVGWTTRKHS